MRRNFDTRLSEYTFLGSGLGDQLRPRRLATHCPRQFGCMGALPYCPAIDILSSGAIDTERVVTDSFPINQFP